MTMLKVESLRSVRAGWLRAQGEVAYLRMLFAGKRYFDAIAREQRFNPYHDILGRFTTADGDAGGGNGDRPQLANRRIVIGRVKIGDRYYNVTRQQERELISAVENATQAIARVRKIEEGWQSTAGPVVTDPNSAEGAIRIYRDLAQEANGRALVLERGGVPLGFNSLQEFRRFGSEARNSLMFAGQADAEPYITGSAVTGYKYTTGRAFDVGRTSDFDLVIVSPRLIQVARERGVELRSSGARTGPLSEPQLETLGLGHTVRTLSERSGRDVNIMIYRSVEDLDRRGPSIPVR